MTVNMLIVDDSLPMRGVIIKTIKASGYGSAAFYEAGNGKEALAVLDKEWLDIVITDYNMPDMNGMELITAMRKDPALKATPILMVTTEGSQTKIDQFLEMGATGYIKKPFTPEAIREKLIEILGERQTDDDFVESDDDFDF